MGRAASLLSQRRPLALGLADLAVAAGFTAGAQADVAALGHRAPLLAAVLLSVTCTASVAWRRLAPAASTVVATTAMLGYQLVTADPRMTFEPYAVALCCYLVGRRALARHGRAAALMLAGYGLFTLAVESQGSAGSRLAQGVVAWLAFVLLPGALGLLAARYSAMARTLTAATAQLKREQELRAEQAAGDERNRVARELHDVLGHCVSVMVIQAAAARLVAETDLAAARGALQTVLGCGREALADLHRIMSGTQQDDLAGPVPGLAQLGSLAERATDAGVRTELHIEGGSIQLPPAVGLACYRVVQEALTNAVKHAGPAQAEVRVSVQPGMVRLIIADTGRGPAPGPSSPPPEPGHGITGLRERVAMHNGWLTAGPRDSTGYLIEAHIPVSGESPAGHSQPQPPLPTRPAPGGARPGSSGPGSRAAAALARLRLLRDLGTRWLDPLLAVCWLIVLEASALASNHRHGPLALNLTVVAALALAGLWRRRAPLVFLAVTAILSVSLSQGLTSRDYGTLVGVYGVLVPPYAVGAWEKRRSWAITGMLLWGCGATITGLAMHAQLSGLAGPLLAAGAAWSAGLVIQAQRELAARLRDATVRLAAERTERSRLAVVNERARIARDLHVLVARGVAGMVAQAEAALGLLSGQPARALVAITAIEDAGREALAEMRRILGVLRRSDDIRSLHPPPGLDQIHPPLESFHAAG